MNDFLWFFHCIILVFLRASQSWLHIYLEFLIRSSVIGNWLCFNILASLLSVAISYSGLLPFQINVFIFWQLMPKSFITIGCGNSILILWLTLMLISLKAELKDILSNSGWRFLCPHNPTNIVCLVADYCMCAILISMSWYLIVVFDSHFQEWWAHSYLVGHPYVFLWNYLFNP